MAKRVFYGSTHLAIRATTHSSAGVPTTGSFRAPQGIQSVGFNTSVAFEPIFQLGQTELYGRTESQSPEVEATISKAFDGTQPLYTTIMGGNTAVNTKQPTELTLNHCELDMGIYSENVPFASGTPESAIYCSGMYLTNVSMTFPIDGMATEEITLVGDTKKHLATSKIGAYENVNAGTGTAPAPYQRWSMDVDNSTLPSGVDKYAIQSVSISMGMGREALQEIGTRGKYCRYPTYPFEVTTDFEVIVGGVLSSRGVSPDGSTSAQVQVDHYDFVNEIGLACFSAAKYSITPGVAPSDGNIDAGYIDLGFRDQPISLKFCGATGSDSLIINLGSKCRATSQNYSGGDTGGDNATMSYSFQSYNEFKLTHAGSFQTDATTVS
jgi:hypothetical protein